VVTLVLRRNEKADEMVKMALHSSISAVKYPPSDLCQVVETFWYKLRQAEWNQCTGNKLHFVKPHLGYYSVSSLNCRDAVVFWTLRIGRTRLSYSCLLCQEDKPLCFSRDCALTVHLLLKCPLYTTVIQKYFSVSSIEELFRTIEACNILACICEIGFYHHI